MKKILGLTANESGHFLEEDVRQFLVSYGCFPIEYKEWEKANIDSKNSRPFLLLNAPYVSVTNKQSRTEYLLAYKENLLRIECRAQNIPGSSEERLCHFFDNTILGNFFDNIFSLENKLLLKELKLKNGEPFDVNLAMEIHKDFKDSNVGFPEKNICVICDGAGWNKTYVTDYFPRMINIASLVGVNLIVMSSFENFCAYIKRDVHGQNRFNLKLTPPLKKNYTTLPFVERSF